jgi:hypothetical protein
MERQLRNVAKQLDARAADFARLVGRNEDGDVLSASDYWWAEHARAYTEAADAVREIAEGLARRTDPPAVSKSLTMAL